MSAFVAGETALGPLGGIEMRMRSNRSPTVRSFQFPMNSDPFNAGAKPSPARSLPWHSEHAVLYAAAPRSACSLLNTPSHTVLPCSALTLNCVTPASQITANTPKTTRSFIQEFYTGHSQA